MHLLYVFLRHPFHPYGLPDPALGCVEHAAPSQLLLAFSRVTGIRYILHAKGNHIVPFMHMIRNLHGKWQIPAIMLADPASIDIDHAVLIHCPEMQEQALILHLYLHMPLIPEKLIRLKLAADKGKIRFR